MLIKKKIKKVASDEDAVKQTRLKTAQQWIPIADINNNIVYRKDNSLLAMLRVQPQNLDLFSDNEKKRRIESLTEQYNGEKEGLQIFCIGRPIDLNNYLTWLQNKAKVEKNMVKKSLLKSFIKRTSELASSGDTIERRFYIIITKKWSEKAEIDIIKRINDLQSKFTQAELSSYVCNDDEILDVLSLFANPIQASFERNSFDSSLSTILNV